MRSSDDFNCAQKICHCVSYEIGGISMNIRRSIRRLSILFVAMFIAVSAGLVYWQVIVAQQVTSNTHANIARSCLADSTPIRGRIFDRNGVLLAESVAVPSNNPNGGHLCV